MIKAFRDTWELGIHSYLTYLRDRLMLARELLSESGSVFVQISDENLHHVREIMDEVFGGDNFCSVITFRKTSSANSPDAKVNVLGAVADYLVWYAKNRDTVKYRQPYLEKTAGGDGGSQYTWHQMENGSVKAVSKEEVESIVSSEIGGMFLLRPDNLASAGHSDALTDSIPHFGSVFEPPSNSHWKTTVDGLKRLRLSNRIIPIGKRIYYKRFIGDFPVFPMNNVWLDTGSSGFSDPRVYVVQTVTRAIERCLLMTTDPGDLVLDPTCGSGTTAFVAEKWGRRWIVTSPVKRTVRK
jgi:adenine-specific DNA-methyltransferase